MHNHICMAEARTGLLTAAAQRVIAHESRRRAESQQVLDELAAEINADLRAAYRVVRPKPTFHWGYDSLCVRGSFPFSAHVPARTRNKIRNWMEKRDAHYREFGWLNGASCQISAEAERRAVDLINNGLGTIAA